jgi:hypothetical protein
MIGVIILAVFAGIWGAAGLSQLGLGPLWCGLPVAISACLLLLVRFGPVSMPVPAPQDRARMDRLVSIWSAIEGVAIFLGITLVGRLGHPEWTMATICLVVGLHFIPLAHGFPRPLYYATGLSMTVLALAGFAAPQIVRPGVVGLGAALLIWATILIMLRRSARAQGGEIGAEHIPQR